MKVSDIFIINQGHQITDEEIYLASGNIPIYTAGNEIKGYGSNTLVTFEQLPCITYQTKAFSGVVTVQYELFDANNTAALILKEQYKECINLEYVALLLRHVLMEFTTADSGVSYLNKDIVSEIELKIPTDRVGKISIKEQNDYMQKYKKLLEIEENIKEKLLEINALLDMEIELPKYVEIKVKDFAVLNKGSNLISEEMIYQNYEKDGVPVYSSATENNGLMGTVSRSCFESFDKCGRENELTWATNGYYAGKVFYRNSEYLYSEKCGRMVLRQKYENKIIPEFLCIMLNQITYRYRTAESTNCKLDIIHMDEIPVRIPIKKNGEFDLKVQKNVVEKYKKLQDLKKDLETILKEVEALM